MLLRSLRLNQRKDQQLRIISNHVKFITEVLKLHIFDKKHIFAVLTEQDSKKASNDLKNRNRKPLKDQAKMSYKLVYTDENG